MAANDLSSATPARESGVGTETPSLSELITEARNDASKDHEFNVRSAIDWLRLLTSTTTTVTYDDIIKTGSLGKLARLLCRSERVASLGSVTERDEYITLLHALLRGCSAAPSAPAGDGGVKCFAIMTNGRQCTSRARPNSLSCGSKAHLRQLRLLLPDQNHDSEHTFDDDALCSVCYKKAADHQPPRAGEAPEFSNCMACMRTFATTCLTAAMRNDTTELLCSSCNSYGRSPLSYLLGNTVDSIGNPTAGAVGVVPAPAGATSTPSTVRGARALERAQGVTAVPVTPSAPGATVTEQLGARRRLDALLRPTEDLPRASDSANNDGKHEELKELVAAHRDLAAKVDTMADNFTRFQELVTRMHLGSKGQAGGTRRPAPEPSAEGAIDLTGPSNGPRPDAGEAAESHFPVAGLAVARSEYEGVKAGTDVAGRPSSSARHWGNINYVRNVDLLFTATDAQSRSFRNHLGFKEPESGGIPARHHLVDGWKRLLDYHWRLLHLPGTEFDPNSVEGKRRVDSILTVIVRTRFLAALTHAAAHYTDLTWSETFRFLRVVFDTEMEGQGYSALDQLLTALVPVEYKQLQAGVAPHLHDDIQDQVLGTARGRVHYWTLQPRTPVHQGGGSSSGSGKAGPCVLCGGDHYARNHPKNAPITIPCDKCGRLHARKFGPNPMTCEAAAAAGLEVQA